MIVVNQFSEVCSVITPGTRTCGVLDGNDAGSALEMVDSSARYLIAFAENSSEMCNPRYGVCFIDTTVGRFHLGTFTDDESRSAMRTLFAHYPPSQVLYERGKISAPTKTLLNTAVSAVPQEALISKNEFLTADNTLKMLTNDNLLGSNLSIWPSVLREMMDESSVIPKCAPSYVECISAFGAVVWYLKRCLIDVDMVAMRQFERYNSSDSAQQESHDTEKEASKSDEDRWQGQRLILDGLTLSNLNIVPSLSSSKNISLRETYSSKFALFSVINKCVTPFGKRLLRHWVCAPVCDRNMLIARQDVVEWFCDDSNKDFVEKAAECLRKLPDLERLLQKIHTLGLKYRADEHPDSRAVLFESLRYNKRKILDLLQTLDGFQNVLKLRNEFVTFSSGKSKPRLLERCFGKGFPSIEADLKHFENAFDRQKAQMDGVIVPEKGVVEEYDDAIADVQNCTKALNNYLCDIRQQLHCSSIKYFGSGRSRYQLEIPEEVAKNLDSGFELKSSRKGFKRMSTEELAELIEKLGEAEGHRDDLRRDVMRRVFADFGNRSAKWTAVLERVAMFDVLISLALYAQGCGLKTCRPKFVHVANEPYMKIRLGYHPSLAAIVCSGGIAGSTTFIPNDTNLGGDHPATMLLTGPNMGGKSTLMRQTAVLAILAHIGSFVPAEAMELTPVDRIFTRIGASDRITAGQSTFYVELNETNMILRNATKHSLVLMDELGRGTSTHDGTAIAYAVLVDVAMKLKCRSFFSTHYHTLCKAVEQYKNIRIAHMACMVDDDNEEDPSMKNVTFLYTLVDGMCPKSHGFFAAKVAGVDPGVIRNGYNASRRLYPEKVLLKEELAELRRIALRPDFSETALIDRVARLLEKMKSS